MSSGAESQAAGKNLAILGVISRASLCVGLGLLLILHAVQPGVSPLWGFISEYSLGRLGILMNLAFFSFGVSLLAFATICWQALRSVLVRIGAVLAYLSAAGMLLGALFNTDAPGIAHTAPTLNGMLHNIGGLLNLTPFVSLAATLGLRKTGILKPAWRRLGLSTLVVLAFVVGFVLSAATSGPAMGPGSFTALFGRLMLASYFAWQLMAVHELSMI